MQCMEVKLGTHVCSSVSMTTIDKKLPQALFSITTYLLLKLANHAMHGGETRYTCVFQCFHDNHLQTNCLRHFSLQLLLHFLNLHTIQCMEVKLGTHVYFSISMTTINIKLPQALFPITTSSLLKLANLAMHESETCVFRHFHDNHKQKWPQTLFDQERLHFSNLQAMQCMKVKLGTHLYFSVSMTTMNKNGLRHFLTKKYFFTSQICKR